MTTRIGIRLKSFDAETLRAGKSRLWERWVLAVTSPLGVMLSVPLATLVVGCALVVVSYQRAVKLGETAAIDRANERRGLAELAIRRSLSVADTLLDRMRELSRQHAADKDPSELAYSLADLAAQRAGLTWLSLSFPDGRFEGVIREADGSLSFQQSRLLIGGTQMERFALHDGALTFKSKADFHYDPRERAFYRLAVEERRRVWTPPYTFYPDFRTGITRAEALFSNIGVLSAVITADYDVSELSSILSKVRGPETLVLFTSEGVVLGVSGLTSDPRKTPDEHALRFADLGRPDLLTFFRSRGRKATGPAREFISGNETLVAIEGPVDSAPELQWHLASILPKQALITSAKAQARKELWLAGAVMLFGVALATALSLGVHRLRKAREKAEAHSAHVVGMLRDLGAYTLEERLGTGGMGEVFRARHRMLARPAAIKLIRSDLPAEEREELEMRFEREAKALSQLRSPHTVAILDYGRTLDNRLFIAMELLVGLPLDILVHKHGPQPAARVIPILVGVCRSLAEAHAAGIVHRDIKPGNLFLCHDGDGVELVKVLDFGLAKSERSAAMTAEGHVAGTPHFMPPEQALCQEVDARSDLYAVGCTAFFLLTGRHVFEEASDVAVMLAHQLKAPPSLSDRTRQWLPEGLELLVQRCLAKDAEFRPPSAAALARALLALPIDERHTMTPEVWRDWWSKFEQPQPSRATA